MEPAVHHQLLDLARRSVAAAARGDGARIPRPEGDAVLDAPRAVFVTLHTAEGALRGCVGTTAATKPLHEAVAEMARAAALRDPRFEPVAEAEVDDLEIEISVLNPLEPVASLDEIRVGRDGLVVEGLGRRGLLLPQVAAERDWTARTFAAMTCEKAGLPQDAYLRDDVAVFKFSTENFGQPRHPSR